MSASVLESSVGASISLLLSVSLPFLSVSLLLLSVSLPLLSASLLLLSVFAGNSSLFADFDFSDIS